MALRVPKLKRAPSFDEDIEKLTDDYPEIEEAIGLFCEALTVTVEHVPVEGEASVFTARLDYPDLGSTGRGIFQVVYHMERREPGQPWTTITLLALLRRH